MIVHTTNSLPDGDKGKQEQKAHAVHANLSPQLSVDLQTQQFCSTNQDCAPSATGTSRVLRSPFVNNSFHEQGMGSTLLRDKRATTALADVCAFKYIDNVARVIKKRVREPTEKTREKNCLHCPAKLPAQSGQKGKQPLCAAPAPTEGRVRSPHKTCTSKRVRENTRK